MADYHWYTNNGTEDKHSFNKQYISQIIAWLWVKDYLADNMSHEIWHDGQSTFLCVKYFDSTNSKFFENIHSIFLQICSFIFGLLLSWTPKGIVPLVLKTSYKPVLFSLKRRLLLLLFNSSALLTFFLLLIFNSLVQSFCS